MTTRDLIAKWTAYALALLPVWLIDSFLFSRFTVWGVHPMLLPLAAVAVAVLEGGYAGAGFGLAVGVLWDAVTPGTAGAIIFLLALVGLLAGLLAKYVLRQDFFGCVICSAAALVVIDAGRIAVRLLSHTTTDLEAMLSVAGREILWTMCFVPFIYLLFRWVFERVPKATVL